MKLKDQLGFLILGFHSVNIAYCSADTTELPVTQEAPPAVANKWMHEFAITRSYESGVSDRLLTEYYLRHDLSRFFGLELANRLSFFDNWGLSLLGLSFFFKWTAVNSELGITFQHERWPSWQTTENRAAAYWIFRPFSWIETWFGVAYRSPLFGSTTLAQAFTWAGPDPETSIIYQIKWRFYSREPLSFSVLGWNYDHMRLYTVENIHFSLQPELVLNPDLKIYALITIGSKGVSGGILSWDQNMFSLGLKYGL